MHKMALWQKTPFIIATTENVSLAFCMCGKTQKAPYCDGSHKGCGVSPHVEKFSKAKNVAICGCGLSANRPFCDGSHKNCDN